MKELSLKKSCLICILCDHSRTSTTFLLGCQLRSLGSFIDQSGHSSHSALIQVVKYVFLIDNIDNVHCRSPRSHVSRKTTIVFSFFFSFCFFWCEMYPKLFTSRVTVLTGTLKIKRQKAETSLSRRIINTLRGKCIDKDYNCHIPFTWESEDWVHGFHWA